uniref:HDC14533 n=1 Tax=Drosophila melanogaster TaxID=7227 RepID=Q6IJN8_DROME|nr:TPA_inf: HDC14533 [Drosophila melanogaster]
MTLSGRRSRLKTQPSGRVQTAHHMIRPHPLANDKRVALYEKLGIHTYFSIAGGLALPVKAVVVKLLTVVSCCLSDVEAKLPGLSAGVPLFQCLSANSEISKLERSKCGKVPQPNCRLSTWEDWKSGVEMGLKMGLGAGFCVFLAVTSPRRHLT